jgi:hypothetical protein
MAGASWLLIAPRQISLNVFAISCVLAGVLLLAAQILKIWGRTKDDLVTTLLYFIPALGCLGGLLLYHVVAKDSAITAGSCNSPPSPSDLEEVRRLGRQLWAVRPDRAEDVIAMRVEENLALAKMRLADEVVFVQGWLGLVAVTRKDSLRYFLERPFKNRPRSFIGLFLRGNAKDENGRFIVAYLSSAAMARLMAWKPPEQDLVLTRTFGRVSTNWVLKPPQEKAAAS